MRYEKEVSTHMLIATLIVLSRHSAPMCQKKPKALQTFFVGLGFMNGANFLHHEHADNARPMKELSNRLLYITSGCRAEDIPSAKTSKQ